VVDVWSHINVNGVIDLIAVSIAPASTTFNDSQDTDHALLVTSGLADPPTSSFVELSSVFAVRFTVQDVAMPMHLNSFAVVSYIRMRKFCPFSLIVVKD
jgi:hypothetical protein